MKKNLFGLAENFINTKDNIKNSINVEEISLREIAIIGMAVRMPKANNLEAFWSNIKNGIDCVGELPKSRRQDIDNYMHFINEDVNNIKYQDGGYLEEIDKFDYNYFGISPKEASLMDPNQRLFMQIAYEAIEDAGYGVDNLRGTRTGVYVGFNSNQLNNYGQLICNVEPSFIPMAVTGNINPIIASRISYLMDFRGPSMIIDTACSSSLVAVHLACQAIRNGECDYAIAGGIKLSLIPIDGQIKIGIESKDGKARTFDENSDGTGWGEGVASILLKPLNKAIRSKDSIYAVIKGSTVNQDGSSIGITAPNVLAQEDLFIKAWKNADVNAETISYIEAHGTGTKLGDPIEIDAIQRAFKRFTNRKQFCAIGSIKPNIGHLDNAAGIAGLIKCVMALKNRQLPPNINFNNPNKKIKFEESPVYVNTVLRDWDTNKEIRRCGVSAFGLSGTNCHVVLEEFNGKYEDQSNSDSTCILVLSAKNKATLKKIIQNYIKYLTSNSDNQLANLVDICYTTNSGRGHYNYRIAMVVETKDDLLEKLKKLEKANELSNMDNVYYGEEIMQGNIELNNMSIDIINKLNKININVDKHDSSNYSKVAKYLNELCNIYSQGAVIDWELLFKMYDKKRVHLPVYPFEETRCWIKIPQYESCSDIPFYKMNWIKQEGEIKTSVNNSGTVVIFKDSKGLGQKIAERLLNYGRDVICVSLGSNFEEIDKNNFMISSAPEDYNHLFKYISDRNLTQVYHLMSISNINSNHIESIDELDATQNLGVYSLFNIIKGILCNRINEKINLLLISECVNKVTGQEKILNSENSTLFGLGKVIPKEYPQIRCKNIDIDQNTTVEQIIYESEFEGSSYNCEIALRDGERYIQEFTSINDDFNNCDEFNLIENGVYVLFGGTGGLGLEIAKHLASKQKINLILISRKRMPSADTLCEIEASGSSVTVHNADICDYQTIKTIFENLMLKYKKINGIIHCAGIAGNGFIIKKSIDDFKKVLQPKVTGTWVIDKLTKGYNLDFLVLFSSINSIAGIAGQGDYTAANVYQDSFSQRRNMEGKRTLAINWAAWKETGMAKDNQVDNDKAIFKALTTVEALELFDIAMTRKDSRIIIGHFNYNSELDNLLKDLPFTLSKELRDKIYKKTEQLGSYNITNNIDREKTKLLNVSPVSKNISKETKSLNVSSVSKNISSVEDIQNVVKEIWKEVLGFENLKPNDNFFEIGGDSIMITKVHEMLQKQFPYKIVLADLFSYPTIMTLSKQIKNIIDKEVKESKEDKVGLDEKIAQMFEHLEEGKLDINSASEIIALWGNEDE